MYLLKKFSYNGFTLIELLVVVSIIGMLASIILSSISEVRASSNFARMKQDMRQIAIAAELFANDHKLYPCDGWPSEDPGSRPLTGARASEIGVICSNATTLIGGDYMSEFPDPPCAGWTYDWENWGPVSNLPTGSAESHIIRISLRANTGLNPEPNVYYHCIKDTHGSLDYSCGGNIGDALSTVGGEDITGKSGKLYCN